MSVSEGRATVPTGMGYPQISSEVDRKRDIARSTNRGRYRQSMLRTMNLLWFRLRPLRFQKSRVVKTHHEAPTEAHRPPSRTATSAHFALIRRLLSFSASVAGVRSPLERHVPITEQCRVVCSSQMRERRLVKGSDLVSKTNCAVFLSGGALEGVENTVTDLEREFVTTAAAFDSSKRIYCLTQVGLGLAHSPSSGSRTDLGVAASMREFSRDPAPSTSLRGCRVDRRASHSFLPCTESRCRAAPAAQLQSLGFRLQPHPISQATARASSARACRTC
jgi:hypothetical protein